MSSQITVCTSTRIFIRNFRVNMVAAIDWCSHTTHDWIWLITYFGLNDPLRQYFSLYRAVSQRGIKKRKKDRREKNAQTTPYCNYCKRTSSLPYYFPNKWDALALKIYPAPSHHPSRDWTSTTLSLSLSL